MSRNSWKDPTQTASTASYRAQQYGFPYHHSINWPLTGAAVRTPGILIRPKTLMCARVHSRIVPYILIYYNSYIRGVSCPTVEWWPGGVLTLFPVTNSFVLSWQQTCFLSTVIYSKICLGPENLKVIFAFCIQHVGGILLQPLLCNHVWWCIRMRDKRGCSPKELQRTLSQSWQWFIEFWVFEGIIVWFSEKCNDIKWNQFSVRVSFFLKNNVLQKKLKIAIKTRGWLP